MTTEIWFKTTEMNMRLPVVPPEFERLTSVSYSEEKVLNLGDVALYSSNGLTKISFASFFPNHNYSFNAYSDIWSPYDYVKWVKKWKNEGTIVRVIITGSDINQEMRITNFNYGKRDGTGDVYYSIDFIEHREIKIPKINDISNNNNLNRPAPAPQTTQRTHKVVKGDSLWSIAQKYYGNGGLYPKIKDANKSKYSCLKTSNVIYPYMTLLIP